MNDTVETDRDWGFLIGVDSYPNLKGTNWDGDLKGAIGDMEDFAKFLHEELEVKETQILKAPNSLANVLIKKQELISEFERLRDTATWKQRRLYVLIAGHGLIPKQEIRAVVLSEATKDFPFHFAINEVIQFCNASHMFEEVLIFMDCCAIRSPDTNVIAMDWLPNSLPQGEADPIYFKIFAAQSDSPTRELKVADEDEYRGILTQLLIQACKNAPGGKVTTAYLREVFEGGEDSVRKHLTNKLELDDDIEFAPNCEGDTPIIIVDNDGSVVLPMVLPNGTELQAGDTLRMESFGGDVIASSEVGEGASIMVADGIYLLIVNDEHGFAVSIYGQTVIGVDHDPSYAGG